MNPSDPKALRRQRREQRAFARMAATKDGQVLIQHLKKAIGWDEAGPVDASTPSLQFWTGQRSVLKLVLDQVKAGQRLLANPDDKETDDDEP